jgi:hypothetical protein
VTLQALLEKVGAGSVQFVTIEGLRANLGRKPRRATPGGIAANTISSSTGRTGDVQRRHPKRNG